MDPKFAHLHLHSCYSLLDAVAQPIALFRAASKLGINAIAVTEHGNMHSAIKCAKAAKETGIKWIPGIEAYFRPTLNSTDRYHITLLAMNKKGYRNLCRLSELSYTEGFRGKPCITFDHLEANNEGIICLSGCLQGIIPKTLASDSPAAGLTSDFIKIFGDRFYMELWDHAIPEQRIVVPKLIKLAQDHNVKCVVTSDVHYIEVNDYWTHSVLIAIGRKTTPDQAQYSTPQFHLKSAEEMYKLWVDQPEFIVNTNQVADRCSFVMEFGKKHTPKFKKDGVTDHSEYLRKLCLDGMKIRYGESTEILARLDYELSVINKLGYVDYFLIMNDLTSWCRSQKILVGPGRGSAAGSVVSYLLGITNVDPIKYNLIFERFLNPERVSDPDIDVDFSKARRDEVIAYLRDRYGHDSVAKIATFSTLGVKSAIRDVGRTMGYYYQITDALCKEIPESEDFELSSLKTKRPKTANEIAEFDKLIDTCIKLQDVPRHKSIHAAGVVIGDQPLRNLVPLYTDDGEIATQLDMNDVEAAGLLKMDILGLETLTIIDNCINNMMWVDRIGFNIDKIPLDDPKTFKLIASAETVGTFQLESPGMRAILLKIEPQNIVDIAVVIALYRPGPLDAGMVSEYLDRRLGIKEVIYPHPKTESILKNTYGVIVFQEQVMQIVVALCGYTMSQADELRKLIGKKMIDRLPNERKKFIEASTKFSGLTTEKADEIWQQIETFGRYGFNISHAISYAVLAYQTCYLKANYPKEYLAALLGASDVIANPKKLQRYVFEAVQRLRIPVYLPDINRAQIKPILDGSGIMLGLTSIDGIAETSAKLIVDLRNKGFSKLSDIFGRAVSLGHRISQKIIINLIKAGSFDSIIPSRRSALDAIPSMSKQKVWGATSLFGNVQEYETKPESSQIELRNDYMSVLPLYQIKTSKSI